MLSYRPVPLQAGMSPYSRAPASPAVLGQNGLTAVPITVPPFGLPPVTSGIILTMGGLVSGAVGTYLAIKGAKVIGKKIPTFWEWYFGTGGIGVTMAILGAVPLLVLGVTEIAGGIIIQKKLQEVGQGLLPLAR